MNDLQRFALACLICYGIPLLIILWAYLDAAVSDIRSLIALWGLGSLHSLPIPLIWAGDGLRGFIPKGVPPGSYVRPAYGGRRRPMDPVMKWIMLLGLVALPVFIWGGLGLAAVIKWQFG